MTLRCLVLACPPVHAGLGTNCNLEPGLGTRPAPFVFEGPCSEVRTPALWSARGPRQHPSPRLSSSSVRPTRTGLALKPVNGPEPSVLCARMS